jgi:hypothetical protein
MKITTGGDLNQVTVSPSCAFARRLTSDRSVAVPAKNVSIVLAPHEPFGRPQGWRNWSCALR